jgi:nucleoid-associated protein YgaU
MTPQTKMGLVIYLSFLSVFVVLLLQTGPAVPPGDHPVPPRAGRGLEAHLPDTDRRAPPLEDTRGQSEQAPMIHPDSDNSATFEPESTSPAEEQFEIYVVQKGDTLSSIARKFYSCSTPACIGLLVQTNKDRIKGKHLIMAGQQLLIPKKPPLT